MSSATPTLQFLGAAGTVTGSMHLVRAGGHGFLLDAGLFQGLKALRLRNWAERVQDPRRLDAVVLSHAHLDHSGYLPVLVRQGFRGPIYCSPATADLLAVMLPDSAHLLEEEAERANRRGYSKHHPALPLYTIADAEATLELVTSRPHHRAFPVIPGATAHFRRAGHILGAATTEVTIDGGRRLVYSGDLGRWDRPLLHDPELVPEADVLLLESTYGDRAHPPDAAEALARVVREGAKRGGAILVPAFALGRTQELLWLLESLEEAGRIPALPVYLDSPMAMDVNDIYAGHEDETDGRPWRGKRVQLTRTPVESKRLNDLKGPVIIIAASGMATGGRIIHHLSLRLSDPRTTVVLVGFQAAGTRGRALLEGAREVRMFGREIAVRATIEHLNALSAHADREELLRWAAGFTRPPRQCYLVHGEPGAAAALAAALAARFRWRVRPAVDAEVVEL